MKIHRSSTLEILEDRIAPAGIVDVQYDAATGELTLTGDGVANELSVFLTGPNTYRIEGLATDIETGGTSFFDIGKLTKLTFLGGAGADTLELFNLHTLTEFSFSGEAGDDQLTVQNLTVKGAVQLHGGADSDTVSFDGLLTSIGGNLTIDSAATATDSISVEFNAQKTVLGGSVIFTGGGGSDSLGFFGEGPLNIGKGVNFNSGAGGGNLNISNDDLATVGKLTTGESILFTGDAGDDELNFDGVNVNLASGIRMTGGALNDVISFGTNPGTVKVGKLATGESIFFDGGADDDSITLSAMSLTLSGGIDLVGGDGTNGIDLDAASGIAKIGKLTTGQSLRLTGGTGSDSISTLSSNLSLAGGVELAGAEGNNRIDLLGAGGKTTVGKLPSGASILFTGGASSDSIQSDVGLLTLAGGVDFAPGDGTNSFTLTSASGTAKIGKLATGQSIRLAGGTGNDSIATNSANLSLAGGIELTGANGTNRIDLDSASGKATVGKLASGASILFTGGTGSDTIDTTVGNLTFAGGIDFSAGDGANLINLISDNGVVKIGVLATAQSILFVGGTGTDAIASDIAVATLAGGIELNAGGGNNDLEFDDDGLVKIGKFGTGQSVLFTGTTNADNEIDFGGFVTLAGSVEVTGGTGSDDIDFDGKVTVGKNAAGVSVSLVGGDGDDDIDFADNIFLAGSLKHDGGNNDDELDLNSVDTLTIKGAVEMIGGTGADRFDLVSFGLSLGSTVTFTGGDNADLFSIVADGTIAGDVSVDLGSNAAATQAVTLESRTGLPGSLILKGAFTLDADAASTTADSLIITNISVAKLIDLKLGGGVSTVTIDNLIAGDEFKLDTRGGADVVNIERGNFFGGSVIKKLATILTGDGDDQLAIGSPDPAVIAPFPDHTRVNFIGGLVADGGLGANDDRNDFGAENTFGVPLTPPAGFESLTLP